MSIFYFLTIILPKFCSFCIFRGSCDTTKHLRLYFWHCFVCTTTLSAHIWIYNLSNGKLASKFTNLYILTTNLPKFRSFWISRGSYGTLKPFQFIFLVIFCLHSHFLSQFYGFTVYQVEIWPQNWWFSCFFVFFALMTPFRKDIVPSEIYLFDKILTGLVSVGPSLYV